jgi:3-oxoacyl-[acyl-carrier protein] reductase
MPNESQGSGRLEGRVALVTGASLGIGRATAARLARDGATVAVNYRSHGGEAEALAAEIAQQGGKAEAFAGDVSRADECQRLVDAVQKRFGRLDILINNAGIVRDNLLLTMDDEEWRAVLATNLDGTFYCCRAAARHMIRQRWGRIVNISSAAGHKPNRGQVNYAASKGGINALTRALASELASRNINVNAVAPGMIETEMSKAVRDAAADRILPFITLNRFGRPEEIASVVAFLVSADADYITGEVIHVDGGLRG